MRTSNRSVEWHLAFRHAARRAVSYGRMQLQMKENKSSCCAWWCVKQRARSLGSMLTDTNCHWLRPQNCASCACDKQVELTNVTFCLVAITSMFHHTRGPAPTTHTASQMIWTHTQIRPSASGKADAASACICMTWQWNEAHNKIDRPNYLLLIALYHFTYSIGCLCNGPNVNIANTFA